MRDRADTTKSITEESSEWFVAMRIQVRYIRVPIRWKFVQPTLPTEAHWPTTFGLWDPVLPSREVSPLNASWCMSLAPKSEIGRPVVLDPFKLRTEFFRLDVGDRDAVQSFLTRAGLWDLRSATAFLAESDLYSPVSDFAAGFRRISGLAMGTSPAELYRTQKYWTEKLDLLRHKPASLREQFAPASGFKSAIDGENLNTMPLHVEWRHGTPQGVITPISVTELLRVTFHVDMLTGARPQICERHDCGVRFTGRQRKFCSDECARVEATRAWRRRKTVLQ